MCKLDFFSLYYYILMSSRVTLKWQMSPNWTEIIFFPNANAQRPGKISHSCSRCFYLCLLKRFSNRLNRKVVGRFLRCWWWSSLLLWQECQHSSQLKDDMSIKSHQSSLPAALQTPTAPILVLVHCTERCRRRQKESARITKWKFFRRRRHESLLHHFCAVGWKKEGKSQ